MTSQDRVRVYRNLNRNCLSVQTYTKGKGWRVTSHVGAIQLEDPVFRVYEAGRQKVLQTRRKSVHAFVIGKIGGSGASQLVQVRYNPYQNGQFFEAESGAAVTSAKRAFISTRCMLIERAC